MERMHPLNGAGTPTSSGSRTPPLQKEKNELKTAGGKGGLEIKREKLIDRTTEGGTGNRSKDPIYSPLTNEETTATTGYKALKKQR